MKHLKKAMLVVVAVMMVGVGVSMAYLHFTSNTLTNTFSSDKKLSLLLREPSWDGYEFQDSYGEGVMPGQSANPNVQDQDALGIKKASNYYPGDLIPKNPSVKNTSVDGEYVAIKVEYITVENGVEKQLTKTEFTSTYGNTIATMDNDGDGIHDAYSNISYNQYDLYLLGSPIAPTSLNANHTSPELFSSVVIDDNIQTNGNGKLPNFQIRVTAYAVQTANIDASTAVSELIQLAMN